MSEPEIERFKSGNGGLGKVASVQSAHRYSNISLREAELDSLLFELLRESVQLLQL